MINKIKTAFFLLISLALFVGGIIPANASSEEIYNSVGGVMCIAYRGDTAEYEANSPEAVESAFKKGADFVSVNIRKNGDNQLVLCSENETEVTGVTLREMLSQLDEGEVLILDFDKEIKEEVYQLLEAEKAFDKAFLRIKDSADNLNEWVSSKDEKPTVIGVCSSFNIFTIRNFVQELYYMPAVQYQSKNHFNVMYDSFCYSLYSSRQGTRAIAPMYNPDLCGQRSDSEDGWNDLIKRNFSVIETNNIEAFAAYRDNIGALKGRLSELIKKAEAINAEGYSTISRENLRKATDKARALSELGVVSADELEAAHSALLLSINSLTPSQGEDTQRGALNVTPGKIIAAVAVGALILAAQIFIYKMRREKKR